MRKIVLLSFLYFFFPFIVTAQVHIESGAGVFIKNNICQIQPVHVATSFDGSQTNKTISSHQGRSSHPEAGEKVQKQLAIFFTDKDATMFFLPRRETLFATIISQNSDRYRHCEKAKSVSLLLCFQRKSSAGFKSCATFIKDSFNTLYQVRPPPYISL